MTSSACSDDKKKDSCITLAKASRISAILLNEGSSKIGKGLVNSFQEFLHIVWYISPFLYLIIYFVKTRAREKQIMRYQLMSSSRNNFYSTQVDSMNIQLISIHCYHKSITNFISWLRRDKSAAEMIQFKITNLFVCVCPTALQ